MLIDPLGPIAFVARELFRKGHRLALMVGDLHTFDYLLQAGGLMRLPSRQVRVQRVAVELAKDVDLCGKAAAGASQGMVRRPLGAFFFALPAAKRAARTTVLLVSQSSGSMRSASTCEALSRSSTRASVAPDCQLRGYSASTAASPRTRQRR